MISIRNQIIKAMRRVSYRKTKTRKGGFLNHIRKIDTTSNCFQQKFKFDIDNNIQTACWSYDNSKHIHEIKVSENILNIASKKTQRSVKDSIDFIKNVIRHEIAHALYTCRNMDVVNELDKEQIPFGLFNLFEDCRIEYLVVKNYPSFNKLFWFKYMDEESDCDSASEAILNLKKKEVAIRTDAGNSKTNSSIRYVTKLAKLKPSFDVFKGGKVFKSMATRKAISYFYDMACNCENSIDLIPILKDFILTFGNDLPVTYENENIINGVKDQNHEPNQTRIEKHFKSVDDDGDSSNCSFDDLPLNDNYSKTDVRYSETIAKQLKSLCKNFGRNRNRLATSGNRIHLKNAIAKMDNSFRSIKSKKGIPTITILIDYSGSMDDTILRNGGREFISAFKRLSDKNIIKANLIFSMDGYGYLLNNHSVEDIMKIQPRGSHEALDNNLKRFFPMVKSSDVVLLFTDGYLTGNIVNEIQYRRQGIDLIACCIPNKNDVESVRRYCNGYFTKTFIDRNPISLSKRIVKHLIEKTKI